MTRTKKMTQGCSSAKILGMRIGSAALAVVMAMSFAAPATALASEDDATVVSTSEENNTTTWEVTDEVKQGSVVVSMAEVPESMTVTLPTKISGLAGGQTFTWDSFDPQGQLASDHMLRIWAGNDELSVGIGNLTVSGGSDTTDVYYKLNATGNGFVNSNEGTMSVTMPNLPSAIAGIAKGTQKYNLQILNLDGTEIEKTTTDTTTEEESE